MGVIENLKDIADLIKKAGDVDLYRKIIESEGAVIELTRENRRLEEKASELEKRWHFKSRCTLPSPFTTKTEIRLPTVQLAGRRQEGRSRYFRFRQSGIYAMDCPLCKHNYLLRKNQGHALRGRPGLLAHRAGWEADPPLTQAHLLQGNPVDRPQVNPPASAWGCAMLSSITTYLGPLVSVAVGWFLHELSDTIKVRREDRRAVGNVLAELLEIRHQWRSLPACIAEVKRLFALPAEADVIIRTTIDQMLSPMLSRMEERYN